MLKEYETEENGITYVVQEYENGVVVKNIKATEEAPKGLEEAAKDMTLTEMAANLEYLVTLAELN